MYSGARGHTANNLGAQTTNQADRKVLDLGILFSNTDPSSRRTVISGHVFNWPKLLIG